MSVDGHMHGVRRSLWGGRALALVVVVFALLVSATAGLLSAPARAAETVEYCDSELAFLRLVNDYRVANGRQPLLISDKLCLAAQRHSSDMGNYKYFDHYTCNSDWFPWGYSPFQRMEAVGYYSGTMGENIAAGQTTAWSAFQAFKDSPGHNELLLKADYKVAGVGLVYVAGSPYGYYWTVDFGGTVDSPNGTRIDDRYGVPWSCQYTPDWRHWDYSGYWAATYDTYSYTDQAGYSMTFTFNGTRANWLACTSNTKGKAKVVLDGNEANAVVVDLYSAKTLWKQTVYSTGSLDYGRHTLTITCLREKNPAAWWYTINVDAFDVL